MSEGRTPTIEQKSTFSSKTKEGKDVEFEAIIKFYINPTGDVKISGPSDGGGGGGSSYKQVDPQSTKMRPKEGDNEPIKKEASEKTEVTDMGTQPDTGKEQEIIKETPPKIDKETDTEGDTKPQNQRGDCAINQFIPDPCRAVDDLTKAFKDFFAAQNNCPPCPNE